MLLAVRAGGGRRGALGGDAGGAGGRREVRRSTGMPSMEHALPVKKKQGKDGGRER
jgi:hypothetical protein